MIHGLPPLLLQIQQGVPDLLFNMGDQIFLYDFLRQTSTSVVLHELGAAAVALVLGHGPGLQPPPRHEAVHVLAAYGASYHGGEKERLRLVGDDLCIADCLDPAELLWGYVGRAIILNAVHLPGVGGAFQDAVDLVHGRAGWIPGVLGKDMLDRGLFGVGGKVLAEDVVHNMPRCRIFDQVLFCIRGVAVGRPAVEVFTAALFVAEHGIDAVGGAVAFVFIDREHDVDGEPAIGRGGVILLEDGLPVAAMCLKDGLSVVVVFDVAEPPIQLRHEDQVDLSGLHVAEQPQQILAVLHLFSGSQAFVCIVPDNLIAMGEGVVSEGLPLGVQR